MTNKNQIKGILSVTPQDTSKLPSYEYLHDLAVKQATRIYMLHQIIDKAIEYIENHSLYEEEYDYDYEENSYLSGIDDETAKKDLLEILKESEEYED